MHWKLLSFILLALCACETTVDVDIDSDYTPEIVVDGPFRPGSSWSIRLTKSTPTGSVLSNEESSLEDATLVLSDDHGYREVLEHVEKGFYASPSGHLPAAGVLYYLQAEAPALPSVSASSRIQPAAAEITTVGANSENKPLLRVRITDPAGPHYYRLKLWQRAVLGTRFAVDFTSSNGILRERITLVGDALVARDTETEYRQAYFSDETFEGDSIELELTHKHDAGRFELELIQMSKEFFGFERSLEAQNNSDSDFSGRAIAIYSNIENGLGLFAGYHIQVLEFTR